MYINECETLQTCPQNREQLNRQQHEQVPVFQAFPLDRVQWPVIPI